MRRREERDLISQTKILFSVDFLCCRCKASPPCLSSLLQTLKWTWKIFLEQIQSEFIRVHCSLSVLCVWDFSAISSWTFSSISLFSLSRNFRIFLLLVEIIAHIRKSKNSIFALESHVFQLELNQMKFNLNNFHWIPSFILAMLSLCVHLTSSSSDCVHRLTTKHTVVVKSRHW